MDVVKFLDMNNWIPEFVCQYTVTGHENLVELRKANDFKARFDSHSNFKSIDEHEGYGEHRSFTTLAKE